MPSIATRGALSANGFGFGSSSSFKSNNFFGYIDYKGAGNAVTVDNKGAMYVAGDIYYGGRTYPDRATIKGSEEGTLTWVTAQGDTPLDQAFAITVDLSGNTYTGGRDQNSLQPYPAIITKRDSSGTVTWCKYFKESTNVNTVYALAIDSSGNIIATGQAMSSVIMIFSINTSGTINWQRRLSDAYNNIGNGVAIDSSNNIYVAGAQTSGARCGYLIKYNSAGTIQWQIQLTGSSGAQILTGVVVGSDGYIYVSGQQGDGAGGNKAYVAKFNSTGTIIWQRTLLGSTTTTIAKAITIDSSNNVYIAGYTVDGPYYLGFIAKYNSSGSITWQRTITNLNLVQLNGIVVDKKGNLLVTGFANFGGALGYTMIIDSIPNDGTKTGTINDNGQIFIYAAGSLTDAAGILTSSAGTLTDATGVLSTGNFTSTDTALSTTFNTVII